MKQLSPSVRSTFIDIGLLIMRVSIGAMMAFGHGVGKFSRFAEDPIPFPDPIGVGVFLSLALAVFAEFFCSILLALGVLTRLVAIPLLVTMLVAVFMIHAEDGWEKQELAVLYALPYLVLIFTGPGRFSLDEKFFKRV